MDVGLLSSTGYDFQVWTLVQMHVWHLKFNMSKLIFSYASILQTRPSCSLPQLSWRQLQSFPIAHANNTVAIPDPVVSHTPHIQTVRKSCGLSFQNVLWIYYFSLFSLNSELSLLSLPWIFAMASSIVPCFCSSPSILNYQHSSPNDSFKSQVRSCYSSAKNYIMAPHITLE